MSQFVPWQLPQPGSQEVGKQVELQAFASVLDPISMEIVDATSVEWKQTYGTTVKLSGDGQAQTVNFTVPGNVLNGEILKFIVEGPCFQLREL